MSNGSNGPDESSTVYSEMRRRQLLRYAGVGAMAGIAGCGGGGGEDTPTAAPTDTPESGGDEGTPTATPTGADAGTDTPTETAVPESFEPADPELVYPRNKDWTKVAYNRLNPATFDWGSAGLRWDSLAIYHKGDQEYYSVLADDWEVTQDGATVTLKDSTWWNGDPVTSKDIWAFYWLSGFQADGKGTIGGSVGGIGADIELPDDKTIEYKYSGVNPTIAENAILKNWNARAWINAQRDPYKTWIEQIQNTDSSSELDSIRREINNTQISEPRGNAQHKVTETEVTYQLFEKHDGHWNADNLSYPRFRLKRVPSNQVSVSVLNGGPDAPDMTGSTPFTASQSGNLPDSVHEVFSTAGIGYQSLVFQYQGSDSLGGTENVKVRHAIAHAINRDNIAKNGGRQGTPVEYPNVGGNQLEKFIPSEYSDAFKQFSYDTDRAAELMQEAGYSKSGGTWRKDGNALSFSIRVQANKPGWVQGAQTAARQLQQFGINAELLSAEGATFGSTVFESDDWQTFIANGKSSYTDPYNSYKVNFGWYSKGGGFPGINPESGDYAWDDRPETITVPEIGDWYGDRTKEVNVVQTINDMPSASNEEFAEMAADLAWVAHHEMPYYDLWGNPSGYVFTSDDWTFNHSPEWLANMQNPIDYALKTSELQAKSAND